MGVFPSFKISPGMATRKLKSGAGFFLPGAWGCPPIFFLLPQDWGSQRGLIRTIRAFSKNLKFKF
jgi:hypothetical protein